MKKIVVIGASFSTFQFIAGAKFSVLTVSIILVVNEVI